MFPHVYVLVFICQSNFFFIENYKELGSKFNIGLKNGLLDEIAFKIDYLLVCST